MESRASLKHSVWRNSTIFSDVPLLPEIFRWNVQNSRVPFNFQPDFPQSVWMVNNRSVEFHCGTVFGDKFWPQSVIRYFHIPIIHLVYHPRVLHILKALFPISLGIYNPPKNLKTIRMQKFGGWTRCIMVNVKVVNDWKRSDIVLQDSPIVHRIGNGQLMTFVICKTE